VQRHLEHSTINYNEKKEEKVYLGVDYNFSWKSKKKTSWFPRLFSS